MAGEYICGIEPGNSNMLGRAWHRYTANLRRQSKHFFFWSFSALITLFCRERNLLEELRPGERKEFSLEIGVVEVSPNT
eukprot:SAG31_NODE_847_length_11532_cov_2.297560_3_plen_79_part_00